MAAVEHFRHWRNMSQRDIQFQNQGDELSGMIAYAVLCSSMTESHPDGPPVFLACCAMTLSLLSVAIELCWLTFAQ